MMMLGFIHDSVHHRSALTRSIHHRLIQIHLGEKIYKYIGELIMTEILIIEEGNMKMN